MVAVIFSQNSVMVLITVVTTVTRLTAHATVKPFDVKWACVSMKAPGVTVPWNVQMEAMNHLTAVLLVHQIASIVTIIDALTLGMFAMVLTIVETSVMKRTAIAAMIITSVPWAYVYMSLHGVMDTLTVLMAVMNYPTVTQVVPGMRDYVSHSECAL